MRLCLRDQTLHLERSVINTNTDQKGRVSDKKDIQKTRAASLKHADTLVGSVGKG